MNNWWAMQKEGTNFVKKCGPGGELKKCGEKCTAKSWALISMDIFLHDRKVSRPLKLKIRNKN